MIAARLSRQFRRLAPSGLAILLFISPGLAAAEPDEAWAALVKGGHVAAIRHGDAPPGYGGDPPSVRLDDCKTQRNLDEMGREQARALGGGISHARRARGPDRGLAHVPLPGDGVVDGGRLG